MSHYVDQDGARFVIGGDSYIRFIQLNIVNGESFEEIFTGLYNTIISDATNLARAYHDTNRHRHSIEACDEVYCHSLLDFRDSVIDHKDIYDRIVGCGH